MQHLFFESCCYSVVVAVAAVVDVVGVAVVDVGRLAAIERTYRPLLLMSCCSQLPLEVEVCWVVNMLLVVGAVDHLMLGKWRVFVGDVVGVGVGDVVDDVDAMPL